MVSFGINLLVNKALCKSNGPTQLVTSHLNQPTLQMTTFFCSLSAGGDVELKRNHNYFFQVQGTMAVTGRSWTDFVCWIPADISTEHIPYERKLWEEQVYPKLKTFYMQYFLPQLVCLEMQFVLKSNLLCLTLPWSQHLYHKILLLLSQLLVKHPGTVILSCVQIAASQTAFSWAWCSANAQHMSINFTMSTLAMTWERFVGVARKEHAVVQNVRFSKIIFFTISFCIFLCCNFI